MQTEGKLTAMDTEIKACVQKGSTVSAYLYTVNMVIFAGGKFCENVSKTFHMGVNFSVVLLFP